MFAAPTTWFSVWVCAHTLVFLRPRKQIGFHWDDHTFLTRDGFRALFPTNPEEAKKYEHYVPATESS